MFRYNCCCFGENHVSGIPDQARTQVALLDEGMHFAFLESAHGSQRLTVNGNAGHWYEEITNLVFSPFPGFFYNVKHNGRHGFILNDQEYCDGDCRCWELALNGCALWTCAEPQGRTRTFIGKRELQHQFSRYAELTADYRAFIYIGLDNQRLFQQRRQPHPLPGRRPGALRRNQAGRADGVCGQSMSTKGMP